MCGKHRGQRLFEQCSKKLHFSYGKASLIRLVAIRSMVVSGLSSELWLSLSSAIWVDIKILVIKTVISSVIRAVIRIVIRIMVFRFIIRML